LQKEEDMKAKLVGKLFETVVVNGKRYVVDAPTKETIERFQNLIREFAELKKMYERSWK
jgi:uncharacterized protein YaaR (DUF327 family)